VGVIVNLYRADTNRYSDARNCNSNVGAAYNRWQPWLELAKVWGTFPWHSSTADPIRDSCPKCEADAGQNL